MARLDCPKCLEPLSFTEEQRGSEVRCPSCKTRLRLLGQPPPATKPEPPVRSPKLATPTKPARSEPPPPDEDDGIEAPAVVRKPRRRKKRRRKAESSGTPEWIVPLAIFVVAFATNALIALRGGDEIGRARLIFSLISLVATVPSTIVGMFVAAAALGVNFGNVFTAALKVAAITAVVQCIYTIGMTGSTDGSAMIVILLAVPVYYGMFMWLFELNFTDALWATFFIGMVQKVVNTVVTLMLAGALMKAAAGGP